MKIVSRSKYHVKGPYDRVFAEMAQKNPSRLIELVESGQLDSWPATWAVEALGLVDGAVPLLVRLSKHDDGFIREGAAHGLAKQIGNKNARTALERMRDKDPLSPLQVLALELLTNEDLSEFDA